PLLRRHVGDLQQIVRRHALRQVRDFHDPLRGPSDAAPGDAPGVGPSGDALDGGEGAEAQRPSSGDAGGFPTEFCSEQSTGFGGEESHAEPTVPSELSVFPFLKERSGTSVRGALMDRAGYFKRTQSELMEGDASFRELQSVLIESVATLKEQLSELMGRVVSLERQLFSFLGQPHAASAPTLVPYVAALDDHGSMAADTSVVVGCCWLLLVVVGCC
ncbi:MAG: hypothetical protein ACKPKO_32600, partial [Candidatus Fonsibacter sp.]